MIVNNYYFLILLLFRFVRISKCHIKYSACKSNLLPESRKLYIAVCDTRVGWKEFHALKVWNVTGNSMRSRGDDVTMLNVCTGKNWGQLGFLTKPLTYFNFIESLERAYATSSNEKIYVILMDSDIFWSAKNVSEIWSKFDCARGQKDVVVGTEMSCWVGKYCTSADILKYYNNSQDIPGYSIFLNSGIYKHSCIHFPPLSPMIF